MMTHRPSKVRLFLGFLLYLASCAAVVGVMLALPDSRWLRVTLCGVALLVVAGFMLSYHFGTHGYWRRSDIGVHLMTFGLANAVVLSYVLMAFLGWIPLEALPFLSALTYWTLTWLFGWRTVIMVNYLRGGGE
jgi:hypothetical protein